MPQRASEAALSSVRLSVKAPSTLGLRPSAGSPRASRQWRNGKAPALGSCPSHGAWPPGKSARKYWVLPDRAQSGPSRPACPASCHPWPTWAGTHPVLRPVPTSGLVNPPSAGETASCRPGAANDAWGGLGLSEHRSLRTRARHDRAPSYPPQAKDRRGRRSHFEHLGAQEQGTGAHWQPSQARARLQGWPASPGRGCSSHHELMGRGH